MEQGWVKFYREWLDNPTITKDKDYLAVWIYLLANATHTEIECIFRGQATSLKEGQLLIKQCDIANNLKIDRFKVMRILNCFENAHLIAHQTDKRKTLITLEQWTDYQGLNKQENALPLHIYCTSEQETENEKEKSSKREKVKEKEINKNDKNERIYNSGQLSAVSYQKEELFDLFWQSYPKKVGKGYARQCFDKLKPTKELVNTMIEAIKAQKKSEIWKRDNGQYIPNPSTWLNQRRWEDDLKVDIEDDNPWKKFDLGTVL